MSIAVHARFGDDGMTARDTYVAATDQAKT
jgi:hypothetical protein